MEADVGLMRMLALRMEEEATSQGMRGVSRSWNRQGNAARPAP